MDATTTDTFRSVNPAHPDDVVGEYPLHGPDDVDAAVASAAEAQRDWSALPVPARAEIIAAAGSVIARDKAPITALVSREAGKVLVEAGGDVQEAVDMAQFVAGQGRSPWGETVPSELGDKLCWTTRQPVGVVGMITPWNFPIAIPSWKIFPALLAGNGVVIKPSEHAPACCELFVAACVEAGVHADLDLAVDGAVFGAFGTSGQRCTSTSRLIVHPDVAGALVDRVVKQAAELVLGDPSRPGTDVGPVITGSSAERIDAMVAAAVEEGAAVATGGRAVAVGGCDGAAFYAPTVLTGVRPDHRVAREEVFGPVLAVIEVADLDDAVDVVNGVEYGLSAAVYTRDINAALRAVGAIDTGIVYVNAPTIGAE